MTVNEMIKELTKLKTALGDRGDQEITMAKSNESGKLTFRDVGYVTLNMNLDVDAGIIIWGK